ncbi:PP2C family protein-serine/threonine phosphatase [Streptomyces sp. NPDC055134]
MEPIRPGIDARYRLDLRALRELLRAQQRRVNDYALAHQPPSRAGGPVPAGLRRPVPAAVRDMLDAIPVAAVLITPVPDEDGTAQFVYTAQNDRAYAAAHVPYDAVPRFAEPVPLLERFPVLEYTPLPQMLADAQRDRVQQGPRLIEWFITRPPRAPVRLSSEATVTPCGEYLLVTWESGHRAHMALAAQKLVRTCWAEWDLAVGTVEASLGFAHVLGLDETAPVPGLADLAAQVGADSLPTLYDLLYDVLLRKRQSECLLRMCGPFERLIRMVAEPVRAKDGPVWAVRAVLIDVTDDHRRRELARAALREAHRQRERAHALSEIADVLRDAVLPRFAGEVASSGLDAAAVYRPEARAGIGGDWYKARKLPDGRLLVALGDARGHGLDAVTLMAKLRYALAGLAYTGHPVEDLTEWLNKVACDDGTESTATAIIAHYHPERLLLRWTCAGHPRPVLLRGGRATQFPVPECGPDPALGVLPRTTYGVTETLLAADDVILLYSDGLVERRDTDPDEDTARLIEAAEHCARGGAPHSGHVALQAYAETLLNRLDDPHRTDDATLLALRRTAEPRQTS